MALLGSKVGAELLGQSQLYAQAALGRRDYPASVLSPLSAGITSVYHHAPL